MDSGPGHSSYYIKFNITIEEEFIYTTALI
jgi:hypothetical protein